MPTKRPLQLHNMREAEPPGVLSRHNLVIIKKADAQIK